MYAFRKPFTALTYQGYTWYGYDFKIMAVLFQVVGYTLSKFIGVKVISELDRANRIRAIWLLILMSEVALLFFALLPTPFKVYAIFLNGLPLGLIWGLVFSFVEGRKNSELIGVLLSVSFIVSSGVVKTFGSWILDVFEMGSFWMPYWTGMVFIIPLYFSLSILKKIPNPSAAEAAVKQERVPLNGVNRIKLLKELWAPLGAIVLFYALLTAIRDFRDSFISEIWLDLGNENPLLNFSTTELLIAFFVLIIIASLNWFSDHLAVMNMYFLMFTISMILTILSTYLFQIGMLHPYWWIVISGFGIFLCYVPFNGLFFDRFIAFAKLSANAGFFIYLADAMGYLSSIGVLLIKGSMRESISWLDFFAQMNYLIGFFGLICVYALRRWTNKFSTYES